MRICSALVCFAPAQLEVLQPGFPDELYRMSGCPDVRMITQQFNLELATPTAAACHSHALLPSERDGARPRCRNWLALLRCQVHSLAGDGMK